MILRWLNGEKNQPVSLPVPDASEARWRTEDLVPFFSGATSATGREGDLALDVYVTQQAVIVKAALAGVVAEDLSIQLMNDLLTIRGTRREEEQMVDGDLVVQECHWGSFSRSVVLPVPVVSEGAAASLKNGILKIVLPRTGPSEVAISIEIDEGRFV